MRGRVEDVNINVLRQCREQAGLELEDVGAKLPKIAEMEAGNHKPTFKQLDSLSKLYGVPRWVFISENLPESYRFDKTVPAFRQFATKNAEIFGDPKVRGLIARVERLRNLTLDLLDDMGEVTSEFDPPKIEKASSIESFAKRIRLWLGNPEGHLDFSEWKRLLESKGVFVFLTSKYRGWSHLDKDLVRGMTIYHTILPIIIINDSDAKKAQSFTLFHELGHLLKQESSINGWGHHQKKMEKWCDEFAGNVLMPAALISPASKNLEDLNQIKRVAKSFKVSSYACLVRLKQLKVISQTSYESFEAQLNDEYKRLQKKLKESAGGPARNRPLEALNQYGHIFANVVFQAYHNQEIGLHRLSQFFDLKQPSFVLELEAQL